MDDEGGDAHRVENVQPGQTNRGEHSGKSDGVADVMMLLELADDGDGNGDVDVDVDVDGDGDVIISDHIYFTIYHSCIQGKVI